MAEKEVTAAPVTSATQTGQKQRVIIGIDNTSEQILAFDQDETIELDWNYTEFKVLPDDVQKKLKLETLKRYALAEAKRDARDRSLNAVKRLTNPLGNTTGFYASRMKIRARTGYHQYWAKEGEDYERCLSSLYTVVRKPTSEQEKAGYEPGTEKGEVLKLKNSKGEVEQIAVECPQWAYDQYLEWMSQESVRRFKQVETDFGAETEAINRKLPRGARVIPGNVDENNGKFNPL